MKTDTIFYQLFQTFPSLLFELIGQPPSNAEGYTFGAREVKQLSFRVDGLFLPPEDEQERPMYFVEVQFQRNEDFYWDFFGEIFLYLKQYKPQQDWRGVAVFERRSRDPGERVQFREFFASQRLQRVYLDVLVQTEGLSLELGLVKLVVENQQKAVELTPRLMQQVRQEIEDATFRENILELVETILVYKFATLSREEIEAMFSLSDLKQTRVYQEAKEEGKEEGKLESVPRFISMGLTVEQIATALGLDIQQVQQVADQQPNVTEGEMEN